MAAYIAAYKGHKEDLEDEKNSRHENFQDTKTSWDRTRLLQNFGDRHGCLVGKYKQFGKKNSFLAGRKTLNPSAQDLKMQ